MADNQTPDGADDAEDYTEKLSTFEDETVTDDSVIDPITLEQQGENDDPVEILGIPPQILKEELDKRAFDGTAEPSEEGNSRQDLGSTLYEGTEDTGGDIYNEQADAFDEASDATQDQESDGGSRNG